jgi:Na+/H+-translocating membrane pyrophosphatase
MATSCNTGAAINIIYGLALGYKSTILPVILVAFNIVVAIKLGNMLGVALSAIGMLSTLSIGLAIDAFGPIADNAGGIAEMSNCHPSVRERTDALDSAGNTTAAIGKGFAISSAALVGLSLFGAFIQRMQLENIVSEDDLKVNSPYIIGMFFIGAMLPYAFSAMTMKSVGIAAQDMVKEVRRQFANPAIRNGT